jgi:hypothetical protein
VVGSAEITKLPFSPMKLLEQGGIALGHSNSMEN